MTWATRPAFSCSLIQSIHSFCLFLSVDRAIEGMSLAENEDHFTSGENLLAGDSDLGCSVGHHHFGLEQVVPARDLPHATAELRGPAALAPLLRRNAVQLENHKEAASPSARPSNSPKTPPHPDDGTPNPVLRPSSCPLLLALGCTAPAVRESSETAPVPITTLQHGTPAKRENAKPTQTRENGMHPNTNINLT